MPRTKVTRPYANTRLATYLRRRILQLKPIKSQAEIATEAGFTSLNMLSMLASGSARLPLDRIPQLAKALGCDPAYLLQLGLDQQAPALAAIFPDIVEIVTQNERSWLQLIRTASASSDPSVTRKAEAAVHAIFGR